MAHSRICSIPDCGKSATARGWCNAHYRRWRRHDDPEGGGITKGEASRFLNEVVLAYEGHECLKWPYARLVNGYGTMNVSGRLTLVSRLVCEHVNGPPPSPDHEAAHSCGKGRDGCVSKRHLTWKTHTENMADKLDHGTHNRGERCGSAKLTEADVQEIRLLKGAISPREIADRFGVDVGTIGHIHRGTTWAWLEPLQDSSTPDEAAKNI